MKNRKVKRVNLKDGVSVNGFPDGSIDCVKHKCEMELHPAGVVVHPLKPGTDDFIVPYANQVVVVLFPEDAPPVTQPPKSK